MIKTAFSSLACLLTVLAFPAHAVPLRGLYEASVPVPDQSARTREQALQQALQTVLIRITGSRQVPVETGVPLLSRASSLVQNYGYETNPKGLRLKAQFDSRAVDTALRAQGLPVWGTNRLSHQVWIALRDDGQARALLDAAGAAMRAAGLLATAEARGVPLSFPDMDVTDKRLVNFNQLWSGDFTGVQGAARRYNPDGVLVVRAGREGGQWLSRWTLLNDEGASEEWSSAQSTLDLALAEGLHELADRQARRFATQTGSRQDLRIEVAGIESLEDYARVLNYLRKLNPVRAARVETLQRGTVGDTVGGTIGGTIGGTVGFRLEMEGDPQTLMRALGSGSVLRRQNNASLSYVLVH